MADKEHEVVELGPRDRDGAPEFVVDGMSKENARKFAEAMSGEKLEVSAPPIDSAKE